ncbi:MAG: adenosylmethionine decarboxylase [Verrucomicrobia bacterium]|nr:adenosylmethionine decarboxylase [Verrucomicrobiota bacterium]
MILGHHTLIELHGCNDTKLRDVAGVRALMLEAVKQSGGTYVTDVFHHFSPHGVSGLIVIAESHVTIHTWPEHGYAAADVFTCGHTFKHELFVTLMQNGLSAERVETKTLERGRLTT